MTLAADRALDAQGRRLGRASLLCGTHHRASGLPSQEGRNSRFYDKKIGVRIIDAFPDSVRISRLRLCDLTARTLALGLHLLGIETLDRM